MKVYITDVESLSDPLHFQAARERVSGQRRQKADRFRFPADKRLSLGAGLLLQEALERAGIPDREIAVMPGGKPYLINTEDCFFNLSHSGTKVLCVLAAAPVGCDIEKRKTPPLEVARRCFSGEEQDRLFALEGEAQRQYFYRIWTGKESYLKMTGEGLRHMPDEFTIHLPFGSQIVGGCPVTFYEIPCGEGYQGTVCCRGDRSPESAVKTDITGKADKTTKTEAAAAVDADGAACKALSSGEYTVEYIEL